MSNRTGAERLKQTVEALEKWAQQGAVAAAPAAANGGQTPQLQALQAENIKLKKQQADVAARLDKLIVTLQEAE